MKRHFLNKRMIRSALIVALVGYAWAPGQLLAQEKGAERLVNLTRPSAAPMFPVASAKTVPMSCPKCQDVVTQVPDRSAKGAQLLLTEGRATLSVVQHQCEGCSTTRGVVGHGKTRQQVVQHTCAACGADSKSCCSAVTNERPTPGM